MSRSKQLSAYPAQYSEIVDFVAQTSNEFVLEFPDQKKAQAFRFHFYSFKTALRREANKLKDPMSQLQLRADRSDSIMLQIKDNPPRVVFVKRDNTEMAMAITEALKKQGFDSAAGAIPVEGDMYEHMPPHLREAMEGKHDAQEEVIDSWLKKDKKEDKE